MITNDLNYYVKNFKGIVSETICNQTIKELSEQNDKFEQHRWSNPLSNGAPLRADIQGTERTELLSGSQELDITRHVPTTYQTYMDKIYESLQEYMKYIKLPYFNGWTGYSPIRWNRYKEDRKMAEHCDHIQSLFEGKRKGVPILSCLGSLNDDFEGGDLVFFGNKVVEFKRGDLLIFPSNFLFPHRVEPVKSGIRWSYISWVW